MILYTYYVVSRSANDHYPVLIARNSKIPLNESVNRANKLERSIASLEQAFKDGRVAVVRITHAEFRKKFPTFPRNVGRKKK